MNGLNVASVKKGKTMICTKMLATIKKKISRTQII